MTDRELLECAAHAVGFTVIEGGEKLINPLGLYRDSDGTFYEATVMDWHTWSPCDDDGDAMRLAVKLGIGTIHHQGWGQVMHPRLGERIDFNHEHDPLAATRRAIVRAAAALA